MQYFALRNVTVSVEGKNVVRDFSLSMRAGEIHALMGPNGSGKSSLAYALAGHPDYAVLRGSAILEKTNILKLPPEERARAGIFLSFQEPPEVGGVSMRVFLPMIQSSPRVLAALRSEFRFPPGENVKESESGKSTEKLDVRAAAGRLGLADAFFDRFLNEGFSGGEKKKSEILQFLARKPKFAIFDEIDSGLDVDSLRRVAEILRETSEKGTGMLVISHSPRLFEMLRPDRVHIIKEGRIIAEGGKEILKRVEREGYHAFTNSKIKIKDQNAE